MRPALSRTFVGTALFRNDPALISLRVMRAEPLVESTLGVSGDDFVLVQWTAEVGDHWIAPLHVHHEDDEAWYVVRASREIGVPRRR